MRGVVIGILCCMSCVAFAMPSVVNGTVYSVNGSPIPFATVQLINTLYGTITDIDGTFELKTEVAGKYQLSISCIGYAKKTLELELGQEPLVTINEVLAISETNVNEVTVTGKSKATQLREESYAVEVIESKAFKNQSFNADQILNMIPGVNIRQSGGFGENAVLSLNGLTGSQVRVFIDGIPMEYFGSSLSINNFPANVIEQIEVYKGVVPIHLSGDALGGAINIATNKNQQSFLDASYSYGSFNTNIASVNAQYRADSSGFTTRFKSFYNYSDNNYKVDIFLWDKETGKFDDVTTEVEHFHDAYNSKMGWLEAGFTNTSFADELMLGVMYSDNYNEMQQLVTALGDSEQPFGEVIEKDRNIISTLHFAKDELFTEKVSFASYLVYVNSEQVFRNISTKVYDWFGNSTEVIDGTAEGGARPTYLTLTSNNILGNLNAGYAFSQVSNLAVNYNLNFLNLQGDDPYNGQNNTRFSDPITFNKQVLASSYTHTFFDNRFKNTAFLKYYKYTQTSTDTDYFGDEKINTSAYYEHLGYGLATSYMFPKIQVKASFEHAVRFPDVIELYGDGTNYEANPYILPEESDNFNLGAIYRDQFRQSSVVFSLNSFIRNSENFIFEQREGKTAVFRNLDDVLTTGFDFSSNYNYKNKVIFNIAGTYVNKVNNDKYNAGGLNSLYKERVPNEPYLYGNVTFSYLLENLFSDNDKFSVNVYENYVHAFDYRWSVLGFSNSKYVVPSQLTTDLNFVYSIKNQRYNFSFGIVNLFDADTYDNLFQQNPGRSFNVKIRYFIN